MLFRSLRSLACKQAYRLASLDYVAFGSNRSGEAQMLDGSPTKREITARATIKDFDACVNIPHLDAYEQARRALRRECEPFVLCTTWSRTVMAPPAKREITARAISLFAGGACLTKVEPIALCGYLTRILTIVRKNHM